MAVSKRLRTDDVDGGGNPQPLVGGLSRAHELTRANYGTGDVRYQKARTTVITLSAFGAGDEFKLRAYAQGADGDFAGTDTIAFTHGTDALASDLQTALRTATGDTGLTVTGTDNSGPFTVTYVNLKGQPELVAHSVTGGACVTISTGALSYDEGSEQDGTPGSVPSTAGRLFDVESSKGVGADIPLGYSTDSRGTAVTRGSELLPPTAPTATSGSSGATALAVGGEAASGGTSGLVLYAIRKLELAGALPSSHLDQYVLVDSEDADGTVASVTLAAGDYVLLAHTQTAGGQVSRPAAPVYFTVA